MKVVTILVLTFFTLITSCKQKEKSIPQEEAVVIEETIAKETIIEKPLIIKSDKVTEIVKPLRNLVLMEKITMNAGTH